MYRCICLWKIYALDQSSSAINPCRLRSSTWWCSLTPWSPWSGIRMDWLFRNFETEKERHEEREWLSLNLDAPFWAVQIWSWGVPNSDPKKKKNTVQKNNNVRVARRLCFNRQPVLHADRAPAYYGTCTGTLPARRGATEHPSSLVIQQGAFLQLLPRAFISFFVVLRNIMPWPFPDQLWLSMRAPCCLFLHPCTSAGPNCSPCLYILTSSISEPFFAIAAAMREIGGVLGEWLRSFFPFVPVLLICFINNC